jgi:hypothetical protein
MRFSKLDAKEFFRVPKLILNGDPQGTQFIQKMVDEIVKDLKKQDYEDSMPDGDDNLDDIDISSLGF